MLEEHKSDISEDISEACKVIGKIIFIPKISVTKSNQNSKFWYFLTVLFGLTTIELPSLSYSISAEFYPSFKVFSRPNKKIVSEGSHAVL